MESVSTLVVLDVKVGGISTQVRQGREPDPFVKDKQCLTIFLPPETIAVT
jgi:hypothetical protein